ncbi:hypothetical protein BDZ89DRAFT_1142109 [Hymenopellis radicata]|nr:hypothetical protein BDZ89DRAFT_1142109 [Hymenopellis radicata]
MSLNKRFQPKDLLANRPKSDVELNANDGLPAPPAGHVQVCTEGHFGVHDPTRAPQFYDERTLHFAVFPTLPTDESDPYYPHRHMWKISGEDDINWNMGGLAGWASSNVNSSFVVGRL